VTPPLTTCQSAISLQLFKIWFEADYTKTDKP
jgi:hypothetical protein